MSGQDAQNLELLEAVGFDYVPEDVAPSYLFRIPRHLTCADIRWPWQLLVELHSRFRGEPQGELGG